MSKPYVRFRLPDGEVMEFYAGEMLGRICGPRFGNPAISETHAYLGQRGRRMILKGVARNLYHNRDPRGVPRIALAAGDIVGLLENNAFDLRVEEVEIPAGTLVLELREGGEGGEWVSLGELSAESYAVLEGGERAERFVPGALWNLLGAGVGWMILPRSGAPEMLEEDRIYQQDRWSLRAVSAPVEELEPVKTTCNLYAPLVISVFEKHVILRPEGGVEKRLKGLSGVILATFCREWKKSPGRWVPWREITALVWPGSRSPEKLRRSLDSDINRLRVKLREGHFNPYLIRTWVGHAKYRLEPSALDRIE